ncbi:MAG: polymer-forming cytoskeletal protein [Planctomycetota bacterium]
MQTDGTPTTVLGAGSGVEGDLNLTGDARIEGSVSGTVRVRGTLELGPDAVVGGDVSAEALVVAGRVEGDVAVSGATELRPTAVVAGTLRTGHLVVAPGAVFAGRVVLGGGGHDAAADTAAETPRATRVHAGLSFDGGGDTAAELRPIPGAVNAALRPRRRAVRPTGS